MRSCKALLSLVALLAGVGCGEKAALREKSAELAPQARIATISPSTLHVRLVNAKSGEPMGKQNVIISWDDSFSQTIIFISKTGFAEVAIPPGVATVHIMEGPRMGKEPGRVAFEDCNSGNAITASVQQILREGFQAENRCSNKVHVSPRPGEVIFYGLPRSWWKPDFQ